MTAKSPETIKTVVTERSDAPEDGTIVSTPGAQPNVLLQTMTPLLQAVVRFLRTYVQGLVGFLLVGLASAPTLANLGVVVEPGDFWEIFAKAAGLALAPAVISLLQNLVELLARLDETFPKLRA